MGIFHFCAEGKINLKYVGRVFGTFSGHVMENDYQRLINVYALGFLSGVVEVTAASWSSVQ